MSGLTTIRTAGRGQSATTFCRAYLGRLIEEIATISVETAVRRDLLVAALAPLPGPSAGLLADEIESHAYWVRHGAFAGRSDVEFAASVERAAVLVESVWIKALTWNGGATDNGSANGVVPASVGVRRSRLRGSTGRPRAASRGRRTFETMRLRRTVTTAVAGGVR